MSERLAAFGWRQGGSWGLYWVLSGLDVGVGWAGAGGVFGDPVGFWEGGVEFVEDELVGADGGGSVALEPGSPVGALLGVAVVLVVPVLPAAELSGEGVGVGGAEGPAGVGFDGGELEAGE